MTGFRRRCLRTRTRTRIRFRRKGRPHPLREGAACVQWLRVIQVQLLPPRRFLVVAGAGDVVMRDVVYRSTVRLRQAACTPGAFRFGRLVFRVSHDGMLSPMFRVSPLQAVYVRIYDRLSSFNRLKTVAPACKSTGFCLALIGSVLRTPFLYRLTREAPGSGRNLLPGAFTFTRFVQDR